jgi:hypothetical protein
MSAEGAAERCCTLAHSEDADAWFAVGAADVVGLVLDHQPKPIDAVGEGDASSGSGHVATRVGERLLQDAISRELNRLG